ncbi:zinc finger domain-containing protein [Candidatus Bathyarchaeota archaeon]|nr:zinc finger domain-containing protein [Candidatus Bathyarchaeota archaeon]
MHDEAVASRERSHREPERRAADFSAPKPPTYGAKELRTKASSAEIADWITAIKGGNATLMHTPAEHTLVEWALPKLSSEHQRSWRAYETTFSEPPTLELLFRFVQGLHQNADHRMIELRDEAHDLKQKGPTSPTEFLLQWKHIREVIGEPVRRHNKTDAYEFYRRLFKSIQQPLLFHGVQLDDYEEIHQHAQRFWNIQQSQADSSSSSNLHSNKRKHGADDHDTSSTLNNGSSNNNHPSSNKSGFGKFKKFKGNGGGSRPPPEPQDSSPPGSKPSNPPGKPNGPSGGGPPSDEKFDGTCHHCGKYGHRAAHCRKKKADHNSKKPIQSVDIPAPDFDAPPQYDDEPEKDYA